MGTGHLPALHGPLDRLRMPAETIGGADLVDELAELGAMDVEPVTQSETAGPHREIPLEDLQLGAQQRPGIRPERLARAVEGVLMSWTVLHFGRSDVFPIGNIACSGR
ncbi:MAG: hypothetical protein ABW128_14275 [Rhizorhabdus sp.]